LGSNTVDPITANLQKVQTVKGPVGSSKNRGRGRGRGRGTKSKSGDRSSSSSTLSPVRGASGGGQKRRRVGDEVDGGFKRGWFVG
jgi:hypothetical protein